MQHIMNSAIKLLSAALMAGLIFTGCQNEQEPQSLTETELEEAGNEVSAELLFEEIDEISYYGALYGETNGRIADDEESPIRCAAITVDKSNRTIVIDYGDGCRDKAGHIRKGKIILTHSGRFFVPGATHTLTFDNFFIDDVQVEGLWTKANVSGSLEDTLKYEVKLEGGKLTFEDGSTITRNALWMNTRVRALNPANDLRMREGKASGVNRHGMGYSVEITKPIKWLRNCRPARLAFVPVEGIKVKMLEGGATIVINYGNGDCDNLLTVTKDGVSAEVEIRGARRFVKR
jgi:hypothetical protein